ncbi:5'-methylthioadenosine/adenosylhomocysteine nucleosidase [Anaerotalea alkaliphila]|uniref:adenosylhomocysteine nucleosidase n=1 Tax=Anaerotalea alkaliphila TaxID=2662126 RepID=A0A7X5HTP2_9FIRM|nr:5'-methylthioadenosine/adenosylhomocysteine nucleosidase [Anaerotalea alkaliphila]NDL66355.1 5'-methylthioadenosine/adenosylhomocysteine nucleosidase [Anaerotalea alkaliphila]
MKLIGIIGAMQEEVMGLQDVMEIKETRSIASLDFYQGTLFGHEVVLVKGGVGKVNAAVCTQILIDCFYVEAIINTGVAGALNGKLEIGDVVISKDTLQHDVDATGFGYALGEIPRMETSIFPADEHLVKIALQAADRLPVRTSVYVERIVSGDQFISDPVKKEMLEQTFQGFCTEMEGAAVAQVCHLNKIPFVILRSISDKADDTAETNFNEFIAMAVANSSKILERMLELL